MAAPLHRSVVRTGGCSSEHPRFRLAAEEVLYGGNGGHSNASSINDGSLVILDQVTAALTVVGHPTGIARLTGLAFDSSGALYASSSTREDFPRRVRPRRARSS